MSTGKLKTEKPRLLIILNRFVIGGPAADTIPLAWHLTNNFDIAILFGEKEQDEIEPEFLLTKYPGLHLKKIKSLRRSFNPFLDIFALLQILIIIVKFKPHIVHTHGAKSGFTGRIAAWLYRVPAIVHTYHGHFFHSYFSKYISHFILSIERALGKITTFSIALSNTQKDELVNEFKILPASKFTVIELGFDLDDNEDALAHRLNFRNKYGLQSKDVAVGIVGRIVPVKNHSFFVEVINNILPAGNENPPAFFIVGDGNRRVQVEKELRQKNILFTDKKISAEIRVVFTSWVTDISEVMNGLDIVVLTSLNEGTPLSIIEAQFFKKPVVSTDAGGVKDSMQNSITGFVVEKTDVQGFCEKLQLLINNKELRTTMGSAARQFSAATFSKQKEVKAIKSLYISLLNKKGLFLNTIKPEII